MNLPIAIGVLLASQGFNRNESWPFEKLFSQAEFVLIAQAVSTVDSCDVEPKPPQDDLQVVPTTFQVLHVVKGRLAENKFVLVHHRIARKQGTHANGPRLTKFSRERLPITYPGGAASLAPPEYMLFLKKRPDDRYECVSGHFDTEASVKQILEPIPTIGEQQMPRPNDGPPLEVRLARAELQVAEETIRLAEAEKTLAEIVKETALTRYRAAVRQLAHLRIGIGSTEQYRDALLNYRVSQLELKCKVDALELAKARATRARSAVRHREIQSKNAVDDS
jgi:hypothetical protein